VSNKRQRAPNLPLVPILGIISVFQLLLLTYFSNQPIRLKWLHGERYPAL
jgi:amino acid transporter